MIRISFLLFSLVLGGCDVARCIINNHPEFSKNSVREAVLNQVYEEAIGVSISNSFEDNRYDYTWSLKGELPEGVSFETTGREIRFFGTPTELGEYPFRLEAVATAKFLGPGINIGSEPEALCSNTETRNMVLTVVQGF